MSVTATDIQHPAVAGYVEAATTTAVMGWAWTPGQPEPLVVELRLGAEVVAEAVADGPRDDLARNGIGEGRHAFTLPVPEALRPRLTELRVIALTPDGAAIPLGSPPLAPDVGERLAQLARGMDLVVGSQRVLHRNVQAALLARADAVPQDGPASAAGLAANQAALGESIMTLELFVTRLEAGLAGLVVPPAQAAAPRWALAGIATAAGVALLVSAWALVRAMPG